MNRVMGLSIFPAFVALLLAAPVVGMTRDIAPSPAAPPKSSRFLNPPSIFHPIFYFPPATAEVDRAHPLFTRTVAAITAAGDYARSVVVYGHTDTVGSDEENFELSMSQARSVAHGLIERGIDASRIYMFACGERQLARTTPDETTEELNRRVMVDWYTWRELPPRGNSPCRLDGELRRGTTD